MARLDRPGLPEQISGWLKSGDEAMYVSHETIYRTWFQSRGHSQHDLDAIALKLNPRPRKTLGYSTPAATLAEAVALTG